MSKFDRGRVITVIGANQASLQGLKAKIETTSNPRLELTKPAFVKVKDNSSYQKKQKGKVGNSNRRREQLLSKRSPERRDFEVSQEYKGPGINIQVDIEKGNHLSIINLQEPKRKRSREATCNLECQPKNLTKPRKLSKAKSTSYLPQLTRIKEETSCFEPHKADVTQGVYSSLIPDKEKEKLKSQSIELTHSKRKSDSKLLSSQNIHLKSKRKGYNIKRGHNNVQDKTRTRKITLKEHSQTFEKHRNGSFGLHLLRNTPLSRKTSNTLNMENYKVSEVSQRKERLEAIQNNNKASDIKSETRYRSKVAATTLKLANETSGFVRTTLKEAEDSKVVGLKHKGVSKRKNGEAHIIDTKPDQSLDSLANRYKSTLESLQNCKTLTAEKLIEELGAIRPGSKGQMTKARKLAKKQSGKTARATFSLNLKDGLLGKVTKEDAQPDNVTDYKKPDKGQVKLGKKPRNCNENQMEKHGVVDNVPHNQEANASVASKELNSHILSGFDRLVSGAGKDRDFEIALAQIVTSSQDGNLGWTKDQEKALQRAYLTIKDADDNFWHLISKKVPGKSANECYDKFYSRQPMLSLEAPASILPTSLHEAECSSQILFNSLHTASKASSQKPVKKQNQIKSQKPFPIFLGHVDSMEEYKAQNCTMESTHINSMRYVGSVLDRVEDEKAVILQSNPMKTCNNLVPLDCKEIGVHDNQVKTFFEKVVISGVGTSFDKENNQPPNGIEANHKKLGVPRVELILKQVDNGEHLPFDSRPKITSYSNRKKKKIVKTSNVYLHSKDALDFGDTTLEAIQRAKQELRNVFSRTGSRGETFFDIEADHNDT